MSPQGAIRLLDCVGGGVEMHDLKKNTNLFKDAMGELQTGVKTVTNFFGKLTGLSSELFVNTPYGFTLK